jgi:hypothetical protein
MWVLFAFLYACEERVRIIRMKELKGLATNHLLGTISVQWLHYRINTVHLNYILKILGIET